MIIKKNNIYFIFLINFLKQKFINIGNIIIESINNVIIKKWLRNEDHING